MTWQAGLAFERAAVVVVVLAGSTSFAAYKAGQARMKADKKVNNVHKFKRNNNNLSERIHYFGFIRGHLSSLERPS